MDQFKLRGVSGQISKANAYIGACLDRSAPFPLDITLFENVNGVLVDASILSRLLCSGEPYHIQRCRSLSWYIENELYENHTVSLPLPSSLERLEYLFVRGFTLHSDPSDRFPQCPRLKEVHLVNHLEGTLPHYFLDHDYTHVEKLTYTSDIRWIDYDIPYIQNFHGIHTLVLEDPFSVTLRYTILGDVENTAIAHLHSLETLKLIGLVPLKIMQRLYVPNLKRIDIATGSSAPHVHSLDKVPLPLLQSVVRIFICLSDSSTPPEPHHLRRIICGAPSLACLTGTSGIGELLAGEEWFKERNIVYNCI